MTAEERQQVVASLPSEFPPSEASPPEGDRHVNAKMNARKTLGRARRRRGERRLELVARELRHAARRARLQRHDAPASKRTRR